MEDITITQQHVKDAPDTLSAHSVATLAAETASNNFAREVIVLDVRSCSDYADYFVIMTGETERHLNTLAEKVRRTLRGIQWRVKHVEGTPDSGWLLLDGNDVVIHIMSATARAHYDLERCWSAASKVLYIE